MKWLFWMSALFIGYTYVGYMAWLWLRARLFPWPVQRGEYQPSVSVVMVVRNEEKFLRQKINNLLTLDYPAHLLELVVVSDGSTDGTEKILRECSDSDPRLRIVLNQLPRGKAYGLNDGIQISQSELVMFTDVRQKIEPSALRMLAEDFIDPDVGCVSGELMLGDIESGEAKEGMSLYWRIEKNVRELESASGSVVGATGGIAFQLQQLRLADLDAALGCCVFAQCFFDVDGHSDSPLQRGGEHNSKAPRTRG